MPRKVSRPFEHLFRILGIQRLREFCLFAFHAWNRYQVARIVCAVGAAWLLGATALYFAERKVNPDFETWPESLWSVWVLLFSGLHEPPRTNAGRLATMFILILGVGAAGLFTASVASLLIERYLGRREMSNFEMDDHLVLCNWSSRGLAWIQEVHAKSIQDKRPVVIIHDAPDEIELPDKQDDPAFNDVYIVKGDPTSEIVLRRARRNQPIRSWSFPTIEKANTPTEKAY